MVAPLPLAALSTLLIELDSCWVKHKYSEPVEVRLRLSAMSSGSEVLLRLELTRSGPPEELVLVDRKGRIK